MAAKKLDHRKCDKAIKGCLAMGAAQMRKFERAQAAGLRTASTVLNLYQDICDVLDDSNGLDLTPERKLARIKKLNDKIGTTVSRYLPG